jgi:beta-lactamase regulating signal transducer with metallopeptidase domain
MTHLSMVSLPITALGWSLVHFVWQGALLWLAVLVARRITSEYNPRLRYGIGLAALILCVALPIATFAHYQASSKNSRIDTSINGYELDENGLIKRPAVPTVSTLQRWAIAVEPVSAYIVGAWLIGMLGFVAAQVAGVVCIERAAASGREVESSMSRAWSKLAERVTRGRRVRFTATSRLATLCTVGWIKPTIFVPASILTQLPAHQLEALIVHELAHIKRYDYLVNFLQVLIENVFFFHPCVWAISRYVRLDREDCCDDLAVSYLKDAKHYVTSLVQLDQIRCDSNLVLAASGGDLLSRVRRIASRRAVTLGVGGRLAASGSVLCSCLLAVLCGSAFADYAEASRLQAWAADPSRNAMLETIAALGASRPNDTLSLALADAVTAHRTKQSDLKSPYLRLARSLRSGTPWDMLLAEQRRRIIAGELPNFFQRRDGWAYGNETHRQKIIDRMLLFAEEEVDDDRRADFARGALLLACLDARHTAGAASAAILYRPDFARLAMIDQATLARLRLVQETGMSQLSASAAITDRIIELIKADEEPARLEVELNDFVASNPSPSQQWRLVAPNRTRVAHEPRLLLIERATSRMGRRLDPALADAIAKALTAGPAAPVHSEPPGSRGG